MTRSEYLKGRLRRGEEMLERRRKWTKRGKITREKRGKGGKIRTKRDGIVTLQREPEKHQSTNRGNKNKKPENKGALSIPTHLNCDSMPSIGAMRSLCASMQSSNRDLINTTEPAMSFPRRPALLGIVAHAEDEPPGPRIFIKLGMLQDASVHVFLRGVSRTKTGRLLHILLEFLLMLVLQFFYFDCYYYSSNYYHDYYHNNYHHDILLLILSVLLSLLLLL